MLPSPFINNGEVFQEDQDKENREMAKAKLLNQKKSFGSKILRMDQDEDLYADLCLGCCNSLKHFECVEYCPSHEGFCRECIATYS